MIVTRQRASREGHSTVTVGDTCWYVPEDTPYQPGPVAVPATLLGGGGRANDLGRLVTVTLLEDAPVVDGVERPAGQVLRVRDREVGPEALGEFATDRAENPGRRDAYGLPPIPPYWTLDLFCPVHGYIHTSPTSLCDGAPVPAPPLPGDAVRLASPWRWGVPLVKVGDIGVLGGTVGRPIIPSTMLTFHHHTFRDDDVVCSSGGPATMIDNPAEVLARTTDTVTIWAWEWKDGFAGGGNGIDYQVTVPVWDWHRPD